jgi:hypothetical protein
VKNQKTDQALNTPAEFWEDMENIAEKLVKASENVSDVVEELNDCMADHWDVTYILHPSNVYGIRQIEDWIYTHAKDLAERCKEFDAWLTEAKANAEVGRMTLK